jgi:hypothetical protein
MSFIKPTDAPAPKMGVKARLIGVDKKPESSMITSREIYSRMTVTGQPIREIVTMNDSDNIEPVSEAKPKKVVIYDFDAPPKQPWVSAPFFLWTPLFFFVSALVAYFFFPDALNDGIKQGYVAYEKYVAPFLPQNPATETPKPVATAAVYQPASTPTQTYTVTEIKGAVQEHLIEIHYADSNSTFDWTKLSYVDPTNMDYALYVKVTGGREEYCLGTVALDMARHDMQITSRLVGW